METVTPVACAVEASKFDVSTLISCTASVLGRNAGEPPRESSAPSSEYSGPPTFAPIQKSDAPAKQYRQLYLFTPLPCTPGVNRPSSIGLSPCRGKSATARLSCKPPELTVL